MSGQMMMTMKKKIKVVSRLEMRTGVMTLKTQMNYGSLIYTCRVVDIVFNLSQNLMKLRSKLKESVNSEKLNLQMLEELSKDSQMFIHSQQL